VTTHRDTQRVRCEEYEHLGYASSPVSTPEVDLLRMRTREGMAVARAKGKLRGKQPKLSARQQRELARMAATGDYTITDLAELFTVSRATV
jgi:DNA invertase Pin-like site-specific DNA recombinase